MASACLFAALSAGCGGGGDGGGGGSGDAAPSPAGELSQRIVATQERLVAQIGDAACVAASQCAALPIGAKPCGGPSGHLAYSTVSGEQAAIDALAREHRALSAQLNALLGLLSDCSLVVAPPVACRQGRCQFEGR